MQKWIQSVDTTELLKLANRPEFIAQLQQVNISREQYLTWTSTFAKNRPSATAVAPAHMLQSVVPNNPAIMAVTSPIRAKRQPAKKPPTVKPDHKISAAVSKQIVSAAPASTAPAKPSTRLALPVFVQPPERVSLDRAYALPRALNTETLARMQMRTQRNPRFCSSCHYPQYMPWHVHRNATSCRAQELKIPAAPKELGKRARSRPKFVTTYLEAALVTYLEQPEKNIEALSPRRKRRLQDFLWEYNLGRFCSYFR